ncbi:sigma-70 family RNA polymerase sigma factor [Bacteroidota bacterium]
MKNVSVSLSEWVQTYTRDLYSWALHKVSDSELAKDLVQDTFLVASEKLETWKGESSPKTWLFSILNHKIIDHYRKKVRQPISLDSQPESMFFDESGSWNVADRPGDWDEKDKNLLDDTDFRKVLQTCLETLPEKWNTCVRLKYLLNKNGEEICQELEIAPTNLWQMVHRAKLQLRSCIETNWFSK